MGLSSRSPLYRPVGSGFRLSCAGPAGVSGYSAAAPKSGFCIWKTDFKPRFRSFPISQSISPMFGIERSTRWTLTSPRVYEWLPWVDGIADQVPQDPAARKAWLSEIWSRTPSDSARAALGRRYGSARAREVIHAECFQICEYGRQPTAIELDEEFPL